MNALTTSVEVTIDMKVKTLIMKIQARKHWCSIKRIQLFVGLTLFVFASNSLMADWFIAEKREDDYGNFSVQSIFIKGSYMRIEQPVSTFIFDVDVNRLTIIFPRQRVFWSGEYDSLALSLFDAIEAQMSGLLARVPDTVAAEAKAEMALMRQSLKQSAVENPLPDSTAVIQRDSVKEINGLQAELYEFVIRHEVVERLWISRAVKPYAGLSLRKLNNMMRLFNKPSLLAAMRGSDVWLELLQNAIVLRSEIPASSGKSRMQVETVKEIEIPMNFFLPPDDYRPAGIHEIISIMMGEDDPIGISDDTQNTLKPSLPGNRKQTEPPRPAYQNIIEKP